MVDGCSGGLRGLAATRVRNVSTSYCIQCPVRDCECGFLGRRMIHQEQFSRNLRPWPKWSVVCEKWSCTNFFIQFDETQRVHYFQVAKRVLQEDSVCDISGNLEVGQH